MKLVKYSKIKGEIKVPPSKSYMQRAVALSVLNNDNLTINNPSFCKDSLASLEIAENLGIRIQKNRNTISLENERTIKKYELNCKESGLCIRMFTPIVSLFDKEFTITGEGSLLKRPVYMLEKPLQHLGATCKTNNGYPPIKIMGPINGGEIRLDASISSQALTGFLLCLPLANKSTEIYVKNIKSSAYIRMTLEILEDFGGIIEFDDKLKHFYIPGGQKYYKSQYKIEGDWSGAAFLLIAAAIAGEIKLTNIKYPSNQPDSKIVDILEDVGANVKKTDESVVVKSNKLKPFEINIDEFPDLFPPLVCLACFCNGISTIHGIDRLKYKESSRADSMANILKKIGVRLEMFNNKIKIKGGMPMIKGCDVDSYGDHRIAMAASILGIKSKQGIKINRWQAISKSYPGFFDDLKKIGGIVYE